MDYFLPVFRKLVFPIAMPFCFRFPPMVAGTVSPMRPMVDSILSAFCNHRMAVNRAFAREAGLGFSAFSFNKSEFHLFFLSMANRRSKRLLRDAGLEARQLVAGSCFSSALSRWLLMAAVASPYVQK